MKLKREQILVACIVLLIGMLFLQISHRAASQPNAPQVATGRYQLVMLDANTACLLDTATGQTWRRIGWGNAAWEKQSPLPQR